MAEGQSVGYGRCHQFGIRDGGQWDEEHTVAKLIEHQSSSFERQAGLARPPGTGDRHQATLTEQFHEVGDLCGPADKGAELRREVIGMGLDRSERREVRLEPVDHCLEDVLWARKILETMQPEITQLDALRHGVIHQPSSCLGNE